jgi:hypothetical protein
MINVIEGQRDQLEGKLRSAMDTPRIRSARKWTAGTPAQKF